MTSPHHSLRSAALATLRGSAGHLHQLPDRACREQAAQALHHDDSTLFRDGMGHLTASVFIVGPDDRVLLTHHAKYNQWQQLGGHLEATDLSLAAAADREAREESGLTDLVVVSKPTQLTAIPVPCPNPGSWHYDVRYTVLTEQTDYVVSDESHDLAWFHPDDIPTREPELITGVHRAVKVARMVRA